MNFKYLKTISNSFILRLCFVSNGEQNHYITETTYTKRKFFILDEFAFPYITNESLDTLQLAFKDFQSKESQQRPNYNFLKNKIARCTR